MSANSSIQWTDHTFNPVRGCTKVSPGCKNCYAARDALRFPNIRGIWGDAGTRIVAVPDAWKTPVKWNRQALGESLKHEIAHNQALRRGESPAYAAHPRPRVFCASLADVFEDWQGVLHFPNQFSESGLSVARWDGIQLVREIEPNDIPVATMNNLRQELFQLIEATPNLDWLLLTKRPENVIRMVPAQWQRAFPPNVWMGTTVEDQQRANERIPQLLAIPAKVRFLSCEPLLEAVDLFHCGPDDLKDWIHSIDWVISGGESGPGCRPADLNWFMSLRDQCREAGVPFFMKQLGGVRDHRGNLEDFPENLRVREFPTVEGIA